MKKSQIIIIPTVTLALLMAFSGCGGDDSGTVTPPAATTQNPPAATTAPTTTPPPTTPAPETMLKSIATASAGIKTLESKSTAVMTTSFLGQTIKADMTVSLVADILGRKFSLDIKTLLTPAGQPAVTVNEQGYFISDTWYMMADTAAAGLAANTWYKQILSAAEQQTMILNADSGGQLQMLLDLATLQVQGAETVSGIQCYKVRIIPNTAKFIAFLTAAGNDLGELGITDPVQALKQLDVTLWVDKTSFTPAKTELTFTVESQGLLISMTTTENFEKVNQPVTVTLPAAAQSALPIPQ